MISCGPLLWSQQRTTVPHLVQFSGMVTESAGRPTESIAFALYKDQTGGTPIWLETQNVPLDESGRYSVLLGAARNDGLPTELFTTGEARWLGVQPEGQAEQPRVLLLSVPYALKAADAETIGGLPPSAFVMAAAPPGSGGDSPAASSPADVQPAVTPALAGSGTLDFIPLWTPNGSTLGNSILFQSSSSNIGVGIQTPAAKLDVKGGVLVRGPLSLPASGTATATAGKNSEPVNLTASAFNSGTATAVNQTFRWQTEPAGNDTASASGTLNLLFGVGSSTPAETGLNISSAGLFSFAPGQTFPGAGTITGVTAGSGLTGGGTSGNVNLGLLTSCAANQVLQWTGSAWVCGTVGTGNGTITGVTAGTDLTGGGTSGNVTLNVDTTKVAQLNSLNNGLFSVMGSNAGSDGATAVAGTGLGLLGVGVEGTGGAYGVEGFSTGGTGVGGFGGIQGVYGYTTSTSDSALGVRGQVVGLSGKTKGVLGSTNSPNGTGVVGYGQGNSVTGNIIGCCAVGVWGDTSSNAPGAAGLVGTADDARAIYLQNNSPSGVPTAYMFQGASGKFALVAGGATGACTVDTNGNLACHGSKSAVVPVDSGQRQVALYAVEAPQNWFEDFGSGQLAQGGATVALEPTFAQTVNAASGYHVFLTPEGDCRGLYVSNKTATGFEVHELGGGQSNVSFDYRIVALRRGYEDVRLADKTEMMAQAKAGIPNPLATGPR